jgi:hypothetical protein
VAFPWWLYIPLIIIGTLIFPFFVEGILFSFIIDAAYHPLQESVSFLDFPLALAISLLILFLLPLREHIRIHA